MKYPHDGHKVTDNIPWPETRLDELIIRFILTAANSRQICKPGEGSDSTILSRLSGVCRALESRYLYNLLKILFNQVGTIIDNEKKRNRNR